MKVNQAFHHQKDLVKKKKGLQSSSAEMEAMCINKGQEDTGSFFCREDRKLRGGTAATIELCCNHRVLPVVLSFMTSGLVHKN